MHVLSRFFQELNFIRYQQMMPPISDGDNLELDRIVLDLVRAHNKHVLVSTYFTESFKQKRHDSFRVSDWDDIQDQYYWRKKQQ